MLKGSLVQHFSELDKFTDRMKNKCLEREPRHRSYNASTHQVKSHLVDEICELFNLSAADAQIVRDILMRSSVDETECKDVALMSWALELSLTNDLNNIGRF